MSSHSVLLESALKGLGMEKSQALSA